MVSSVIDKRHLMMLITFREYLHEKCVSHRTTYQPHMHNNARSYSIGYNRVAATHSNADDIVIYTVYHYKMPDDLRTTRHSAKQ